MVGGVVVSGAEVGVLAGEVEPTVPPPDEGTVVGLDVVERFDGERVEVE